MINDMGPTGGILFVVLALLLLLTVYKGKSFRFSNMWNRIFKNTILIVLGLLILVLVTNGKDIAFFFHLTPGSSTILIIMTLVFFYSIFISLGTYESRLYLSTSFFMLTTPGLVLSLGEKESFGILVALPFIALGTIILIRSSPFSKAKRLSEYQNWVLGNLAIANLYMPLRIQQLPPALVTWLLCIGCLAIGNNKRLNSFEEDLVEESDSPISQDSDQPSTTGL